MQQTIKLGNLTLPRTAGLAPMAGVADRAYRILCKEHQAALLVSEMISAKDFAMATRKPLSSAQLQMQNARWACSCSAANRISWQKRFKLSCPISRTGLILTWAVRFIKSLQPALVRH